MLLSQAGGPLPTGGDVRNFVLTSCQHLYHSTVLTSCQYGRRKNSCRVGRWGGSGPAQVQTCGVVSRPTPGGSPAFSGESPDAKSRGGEAFLIQPAQLGGLVVFSGPAQVRTCEVVSRPTPGGSPAFSGESRRKERRGLRPLDPRFMTRSFPLARFGVGCHIVPVVRLFRGPCTCPDLGTFFRKMLSSLFFPENAPHFGAHVRALIWELSFAKCFPAYFSRKMRPKSVLAYRTK
jgi:hypothetical protein